MIFTLVIIFFILGLIIGSFLNVVILRMNTQKFFFGSLGGRSACMSCEHRLAWYELIPLFSFLVLGGRCKTCKTKISMQYPLVEFTAGMICAVLFLKFQLIFFLFPVTFSAVYAYYAVMFSLLVVIVAYDVKHKIIPGILSFIFGLLAFAGLFFFTGYHLSGFHIPSLVAFLSGPLAALPFALLWLVSGGRWMGLGDAKLMLGLGWFLGPAVALSGMVLAFSSGAIIGVCLVMTSPKYGMKSEIPFAPYLALGAFIAFLLQLNLFNIYF